MTRLFWELYLPVLAILGGLGIVTGVISGVVERAWRRWRCRREMQRIEDATPFQHPVAPSAHEIEHARRVIAIRDALPISKRNAADMLRRAQLENLATARDKAERKIH